MIPFYKYVPARIFLLVCLHLSTSSPETYAQHYPSGIKKEGKANHFIMTDQPEWFFNQVDTLLQR